MNRLFASACLLLIATACGAEPSISVGHSGTLPVKEWCAEYRQVLTSFGFQISGADGGAVPLGPESLPGPVATEFVSMMEKLKALAEKAPAEIRDDLKATWDVPPGALASAPPAIPSISGEAGLHLAQRLERSMRWISDNCGDEMPSGGSSADEMPLSGVPQPVGDWQAVQRGSVGGSHWTFFRTEATEDGACVAFEAEPNFIDWEARIRAQAPPGVPVPPMPPPSVPEGFGLAYKGKIPQCGPKPDLFDRSDPVVFWVQEQDATNRYNVLAGSVVDSARSLTITFEEGGQEVVTPVDGTFVVTYDSKFHVAKVMPDLGAESQVTCEPLPQGGGPPGVPEFLSLSCQGSTTRSGLPVPPFGLPKR